MARITKYNGRKPVEDGAIPFAGTGVQWDPKSGDPGMVTGRGDYRLTVGKHIVHLSEEEMLDTVLDWMVEYRREKKRAAAKSGHS